MCEAVDDAWNGISDTATSVADSIGVKDPVNDVSDAVFQNFFKPLAGDFGNPVEDLWNGASDLATGVSDSLGIKNPVDNAWDFGGEVFHYLDPTRKDWTLYSDASDMAAQFDDWVNDTLWRDKAKADKAAEAKYKAEQAAQVTKGNYEAYQRNLQTLAQLREARLKRSQAVSSSFSTGSGITSSNILGSLGSLGSQVATNQGKVATSTLFGNYMSGLNHTIAEETFKLNKLNANMQSNTALFNSVAAVGGKMAGAFLGGGGVSG